MMPGVDVEEEVAEEGEEVDNIVLDSAASFVVAVANSELQTPKSA